MNRQIETSRFIKKCFGCPKSLNNSLYFFQHSKYQIHILNLRSPYPHYKISLQNPIQHFEVVSAPNTNADDKTLNYLVVLNNSGSWVAYEIAYEGKQIAVKGPLQSLLDGVDDKVVGIHLLEVQTMMIIFVKENGLLEYNYLNPSQRPNHPKTMKANKAYIVEIQNDPKQKKSKRNLISKYKGRQLLATKNQNKIINSTLNINTRQLIVVVEELNSGVCNVGRYFLQDYQVITGTDFLANLPTKPLDIFICANITIINLGTKLLLWARNITQDVHFADGGYCTHVMQLEKLTLLCCIWSTTQHSIQTVVISPTPKHPTQIVSLSTQMLTQIISAHCNESYLTYIPVEYPKAYPSIVVTTKLELKHLQKQKDNPVEFTNVLTNMQAEICRAVHVGLKFGNYLKITKRVGYLLEDKIYTNNRILTHLEQYQHNILIKMAHLMHYAYKSDSILLYISSPIIGTLNLSINFSQQAGTNKKISKKSMQQNVSISLGRKEQGIILEQQSLYLRIENQKNYHQLTPTKLISGRNKIQISQLFEQKTDTVIGGCIVGSYILMGVQKQVHIFISGNQQKQKNKNSKPKFLHIYCFDSDIRKIIPLNNVNLWGAFLWDGNFEYFRIQQKQSIKVGCIDICGSDNQNYFTFNSTINTAPHSITLLPGFLLICTNDSLHIYQPQKTKIRLIALNSQIFGQSFYPYLQQSQLTPQSKTGSQKFQILSNVGSRWIILGFYSKYLVNDIDDIKIQVEEIIGFPTIDGLLFCAIKDFTLLIICANRILVGTLQTGSITYNSISVSGPMQQYPVQKQSDNFRYLKGWLKKQQIILQKYTIQGRQRIKEENLSAIKLNQTKLLLYNDKQIWYAFINKKSISLISYFSMPNDAFIEFRNNLGVHQLDNKQFMEMFAQKLTIISVTKISQILFAILYGNMIVLLQVNSNGALMIRQEIFFKDCPGLISVTQFVGVYDQMSIYMKDSIHRLLLLKYDIKIKKYVLQILEQLEDQIVSIYRVKNWKERVRKIDKNGKQSYQYQQMVVRKDGQLIEGKETRPIYI